MSKRLTAALLLGMTPASAAFAQERQEQPELPGTFRQLMECRAISEPERRLACFDRGAATLDEATRRRDIVISDKNAVKRARRGLFGFAAPVGRLMGFGGDDDESEQIKEITTSVAGARKGAEGWRLDLGDGSTWEQNDTRDFVLSPKTGDSVRITKGALGTYFLSVKSQRALRMRRVK